MKTLLFLAIILSAGVCLAADPTPPANDAAANTSVAANELNAIKQRCHVAESLAAQDTHPELSVTSLVCMQQNEPLLKAAKDIDDSLAGVSAAQKHQIIESCSFNPSTDDLKTLTKKQKCVADQLIELSKLKTLQAAPNQLSLYVLNTENVLGLKPSVSPPPPPPASGPEQIRAESVAPQGAGTPPAAAAAPTPAAPQASAGQQVGSSAYTTRSTCLLTNPGPANGSAINNPGLIGVRRELLAPKEASDQFGYRLGKRYIIYQVSVTDFSKDYQYVVHDITVNLKTVMEKENPFTDQSGGNETADLASSRRLDLLRGIPEKGQDLDPRNLTLHILTGLGSVAGGVSGLTPFSNVMGSAVSVFNGAFLQDFVGIAPDHTGTQLNRLSDEAFASNALVDKLHTKDFAIFIPQALVLKSKNQSRFWRNTRGLLDDVPLDQVDVCVDGSLVTEVSITASPAFSVTDTNVAPGTTVSISDSDSDATIYYTDVDGTTPTASSTDKYTAPIALPAILGTTKIVRAIAVSPNKQQSSIVSHTYVVQRIPTPDSAPANASKAPATVTLKLAAPGDDIYYTLDGTTPTTASTKYATPINIPSSQTLKVIEVTAAGAAGPVATFDYKLK
jgi:hypothetical protein